MAKKDLGQCQQCGKKRTANKNLLIVRPEIEHILGLHDETIPVCNACYKKVLEDAHNG